MRILYHSVAGWVKSGYGKGTKAVLPRLKAHGHDVVCFSIYGLLGIRTVYDGIPYWGLERTSYGSDIIRKYVNEHQSDIVITFFDQFVLPSYAQLGDMWAPYAIIHWLPIEDDLRKAIQNQPWSMAMCRWAQKLMKDELDMDAAYVPLGVESKDYRPLFGEMNEQGKIITPESLRLDLGDPVHMPGGAFVVGMVAANQDFRKNMEQQIRAFAAFAQRHDDARLLLHTNLDNDRGGWDIIRLLDVLKIRDKVMATNRQVEFSEEEMVVLYNTMDVFMNVACSEGFGLPILEAQSCGVPVIVTNFSAMPEVGPVGWHLPYDEFVTPRYGYGAAPLFDPIVEALEEAYQKRGDKEMTAAAREHGKSLDWSRVVNNYWEPFLDRYMKERVL